MLVKKNIAIIQARMGSSRLPGKMLMKIGKYPLIEWVIRRLKKTKRLDKLILATTKNKNDSYFKEICKKFNIVFFAGSENDVLKRFNDAVKKIKHANIIRVCADNPFIDPHEIDKLIYFFDKNDYDYVSNHQNKNRSQSADGFGAEIFSIQLLRKLNMIVKNKSLREHVTLYIWNNNEKFKIHSIKAKKELAYPNLKFDVNTLQDLNYLNCLSINKIRINTPAKKIITIAIKNEN